MGKRVLVFILLAVVVVAGVAVGATLLFQDGYKNLEALQAQEAARAELLVILTDIDGLYTSDPRKDPDARLIHVIPALTDEVMAMAGGSGSSLGTGGMMTKLHAAQIATAAGIDMVIASGRRPEALYDIVDGKEVGTRFLKNPSV